MVDLVGQGQFFGDSNVLLVQRLLVRRRRDGLYDGSIRIEQRRFGIEFHRVDGQTDATLF